MKVNYLILKEVELAVDSTINVEDIVVDVSKETYDSIEKVLCEGDKITVVKHLKLDEVKAINETVKTLIGFTHVCLIPNESLISEVTNTVIKKYIKDEEALYLPLISYLVPDSENNYDLKGILNSCIWKPYLAHKTGVLNLDLSLKQIDTTLYGSFIPLSLFQKYLLKEEIKLFPHFEFLNRIIFKKEKVLGIPKLGFHLKKDYEQKTVNNEEKKVYFKMAQESYKD